MKINNLKNKIIASVLALATALSSFAAMPNSVLAAEDYYVHFVDNLDSTKHSAEAKLLEGESIDTVSKPPKGYFYLPTPFKAEVPKPELDPIIVNSITAATSITAKVNVPAVITDGKKQYNIRPQFSATPTRSEDGNAIINIKNGVITEENTVLKPFAAELKAGTISIIEESTIVLNVTKGEEDTDKPTASGGVATPNGKQKEIKFAEIKDSDTTGVFKDYAGKTPGSIVKDGKIMVLLEGSQSIPSITLELQPLGGTFPVIYQGSKIPIRFSLQGITPMKLTIVSRENAVDEIAKSMQQGNKLDSFFKFKGNDSMTSVTSESFEIVRRYDDFNYKSFIIDWKWEPIGGAGVNAVEINKNIQPNDETVLAKIHPEEKSITGNLVATVAFRKAEENGKPVEILSDQVKIPITIVGTGTKPEIKPTAQYKGTVNGKDQVDAITDNKFPSKMDVNDGTHAGFTTFDGPYKVTGSIDFGTGAQKASKVKVNVTYSENGKADFFLGTDKIPYVSGTDIVVGNDESTNFKLVATHEGKIDFSVQFIDEKGNVYNKNDNPYRIEIVDNSPNRDASFKDIKLHATPVVASSLNGANQAEKDAQAKEYADRLKVIYPNEIIPFSFAADKFKYDITVPFAVEKVDLTPIYMALKGKPVSVKVSDGTVVPDVNGYNEKTDSITLPSDGKVTQIFINATAEDSNYALSYTLNITRAPQSTIASLVSLEVMTYKDKKSQTLTPTFSQDVYEYTLSLPYGFKGDPQKSGVSIKAASVGDWGEKPSFTADFYGTSPLKAKGFFGGLFGNPNQTDLKLQYNVLQDGDIQNTTDVTITVRSEDRKQKATYHLHITIEDPSENNLISDLKVFEKDKIKEIPFVKGQTFNKNSRDFTIEIPFKTDKIWFSVMPDDKEKAQAVRITYPPIYPVGGKPSTEKKWKKGSAAPLQLSFDVPFDPKKPTETSKFTYAFEVQAENDKFTGDGDGEPYTITVERLAADSNADLSGLVIANVTDSKPIEEFVFSPIKYDYSINVPFTTEEVSVAPTVKSPLTIASVNGTEIKDGRLSKNVKLSSGAATTITVVTVPESGTKDQKTYTIKITRTAPNTEARLKNLTVNGGANMLPNPFVPSTLIYTAEIPNGTKTYTITPTLADEKASVTINKKAVKSGQPSETYTSVDAVTVYDIVVTAQDMKTTQKYTLTITDYNLIKKSDKADLLAINPNYGDLKPNFKSNIDTYQVFLKPDAKKFEIKPVVSPRAKVEVLVGSKVLTANDGVYATSVFSDKDAITIKVTPEDGNAEKTKIYTLNLIKNDKKEQGKFKPITADMVDYEADPILIDITNYAVIDATVFNKLKTDFPKKTIIFSGNDYMLKIKGEDIKELVPHTTQYDLSFSFTTPDESIISGLMYQSENSYDWQSEPVYLYFDDHGPLPGQMLLTISLGREYQNRQLFWNYFNDERERIDYYGYINSNAKGTITVPITHLSTYMVTKRQLDASENKTAMGFGWIQNSVNTGNETITSDKNGTGTGTSENGNVTDNKHNPQTGIN